MNQSSFAYNMNINCDSQSAQTPHHQMSQNTISNISLNHPPPYGYQFNDPVMNNNVDLIQTSLIHQPFNCGDLIQSNMSNRERRIYHRLNHRCTNHINTAFIPTCIGGGQDLLTASLEDSLMHAQQQLAALMKQREAYTGCDSKGFIHFIPNSIVCSNHKYSMTSELGRGTFSRVFRCHKLEDNTPYAIKIIRNVKKYQLAAMNELTILKRIAETDVDDTSCCIHVVDCGLYYEHPMFVFPLLSTSLRSWMNSSNMAAHKPFCFDQVIHLMWQLCRGIAFMHSLKIINTDLKPDNIMLLSDEMDEKAQLKSTHIKIIDFGSAVIQKEGKKYNRLIQTRQYRAPEVILGMEWSFEADIWSLGCILVELMDGKLLFPSHSDTDQLQKITQCIGTPPRHLLAAVEQKTGDIDLMSHMNDRPLNTHFVNGIRKDTNGIFDNEQCAQLHDLCTKMLCWNPKERISAKVALQHPIFYNREKQTICKFT